MKYWTMKYVRRIVNYISYIIAFCLVIFSFLFAIHFPRVILPQITQSPLIRSYFSPSITPLPLVSLAPITSGKILSEEILYPQLLNHLVKINNLVSGTSGSGVIIWAGKDYRNTEHTFILTNRHVLPVGTPGTIEVFDYLNFRDIESVKVFPAFSVTQSSSADLALVEVLSSDSWASRADFISSEDFEQMPLYTELLIVGCGLGNPPFISSGRIIIFDKEQLMLNGFSIYGCSGGGVFDHRGRLVSLTSKIGMVHINNHDHPITNISISIPVNVICDWLLETKYKFIVNSNLGSLNDIFKPKKYY